MTVTDEAGRILNFLAGAGPHANTSVPDKIADEVMLTSGGSVMARGKLYEIRCRRISPNVCKLSLRKPKP